MHRPLISHFLLLLQKHAMRNLFQKHFLELLNHRRNIALEENLVSCDYGRN